MNTHIRDMTKIVSQNPLLANFKPEHKELIAGCASNVKFDAGELIFREGEPAERFFLIRYGKVSVEVFSPSKGRVTIQTYEVGDVLGWSWIVKPYRCYHDARALDLTRAIAFDGACLRNKADSDPEFGYTLLKCFAPLIAQNLERVELQLLDVYGQSNIA